MTTSRAARRMLLIVVASAACASTQSATVVRRFQAAEANQGVAVDASFFYAIDNARIGKYDKIPASAAAMKSSSRACRGNSARATASSAAGLTFWRLVSRLL